MFYFVLVKPRGLEHWSMLRVQESMSTSPGHIWPSSCIFRSTNTWLTEPQPGSWAQSHLWTLDLQTYWNKTSQLVCVWLLCRSPWPPSPGVEVPRSGISSLLRAVIHQLRLQKHPSAVGMTLWSVIWLKYFLFLTQAESFKWGKNIKQLNSLCSLDSGWTRVSLLSMATDVHCTAFFSTRAECGILLMSSSAVTPSGETGSCAHAH